MKAVSATACIALPRGDGVGEMLLRNIFVFEPRSWGSIPKNTRATIPI